MIGSIPSDLVGKRISEALRIIQGLPDSPGQKTVHSALTCARARIAHLEQRLGETETMRDRIAMQLLPGIIGGAEADDTSDWAINRAYELADRVLQLRVEGSAGALGETTPPKFPEYELGDEFQLAGETATIKDVHIDGRGVRFYDFSSEGRGYEGNFTAADIAAHQTTYGDAP